MNLKKCTSKKSMLIFILTSFLTLNACQKPQPPNIVFFLVDDLGWTDLSCYGSEFYDTPNLDSLASHGIRFTDAYAASPVCSPTRAAIMTGKHPVTVGITDWIPGHPAEKVENALLKTPEDIHNLPLEEVTLAEAFKEKGYHTFFAGKWHLGETPEYWPERQGFDINKGGHHKGSPPGGYYSPYNNPRLKNGTDGEYLTDRLTRESLRFLDTLQGGPFFLYLCFYTVHTPIQGCERYDSIYFEKKGKLPGNGQAQTRSEHLGETRLNQTDPKYAAMVRCMDENVGRVLHRLRELNIDDNTIIVFTSDNGGLTTKQRYGPTAVMPLRAGKGWCYEGGIRVPLIVKAPGIAGGKTCNYPVTSMDYFPTLLELAGLQLKKGQHTDGESFVKFLKKPEKPFDRTLVWHYPHYHGSTWRPGSAIRQNEWKLIYFYEDLSAELYHLSDDIGEQRDVSLTMPQKTEALIRNMRDYIDRRAGKYPVKHTSGN